MSQLTMQPDPQGPDRETSRSAGWVRPPKAEDEGLSIAEIKWIPLVVPLAALMLLLGAAAVLSMA